MALSKKQLQHKREKKNKKRQTKTKPPVLLTSYYHWPLYECWIPTHLWETGIGQVTVTRKNDCDQLAVGVYLLDVFCLGIRDCDISVIKRDTYEEILKGFHTTNRELQRVDPSYAHTLIYQVEAFAKQLGFEPHSNFSKAKKLLKNIPLDAALHFTFGKEGKPCYLQGPEDSRAEVSRIIQTLEARVGREHDDFLIERLA